MSECLVIPPGMINNTVVALSKDRMCTVFWDEKTKTFQSAEVFTLLQRSQMHHPHQLINLNLYASNTDSSKPTP